MSRRRLEFRLVLAVLLVWSAWPTVAAALDRPEPHAPAAMVERVTSPASEATVSSTSTLPPASTSTTATLAPSSAPVDPAPPEPPPSTAQPPTPTDPPMTAAPASSPVAGVEELSSPAYCDGTGGDLVTVTNRDRQANGLAPVCPNARLDQIAQQWAEHLAATSTFAHQDLWTVVDTTPFYAMAENLLRAPGPISVDQMETLWMDSPEHRVNIVNSLYVAVGVGMARDAKGVTYAVVELGGTPR